MEEKGCYAWLIGSAITMSLACSTDPGKSLAFSLEVRDPEPGTTPFETIESCNFHDINKISTIQKNLKMQ